MIRLVVIVWLSALATLGRPRVAWAEPPTEAPKEAPTEAPKEAPKEAPTDARHEPPTESPSESPSESAMERGFALFDENQFAAAAESFAESFLLNPSAKAKQNEAAAWERADEPARAADAYHVALGLGTLSDDWIEHARRRLDALRTELGVLELSNPAGAKLTIGHVTNRSLPVVVHLPPGTYPWRVVRPAPAERTWSGTVTIERGVRQHVTIDTAAPPPTPAPSPEPAPAETSPAFTVAMAVTLGVGVAAAIAAVPVTVHFANVRADYHADRRDPALFDKAKNWQVGSSVAVIGGAALTAIGAAGLIVDHLVWNTDDASVALSLAPTGGRLHVRW